MPEEVRALFLCQRFGWTWDQYLDTPDWVIQLIALVERAEANVEIKKAL